jgi:predicted transcriptional regulator
MEHHLLEDSDVRKVFQRIARERIVSFRDLSNLLDREAASVRDDLHGLLGQLVESGLIEEQEAPITDFNAYYLTADGLAANRTRTNLERKRHRIRLPKPRA